MINEANPKTLELIDSINSSLSQILNPIITQQMNKRHNDNCLEFAQELVTPNGEIISFSVCLFDKYSKMTGIAPSSAKGKRPLFTLPQNTAIYVRKRPADETDEPFTIYNHNNETLSFDFWTNKGEVDIFSLRDNASHFYPFSSEGSQYEIANQEKMLETTEAVLKEYAELQREYMAYQASIL